MTDKVFLDTNLWIYLYAKSPPEKSQQVAEIIKNNSLSLLVITLDYNPKTLYLFPSSHPTHPNRPTF
jgi:predicted nucleic acid-binding protein